MAEPIGALRAELTANAKRFENDMKQARQAVKGAATSMRSQFSKLNRTTERLTKRLFSFKTALVGAAGAAGLFMFSRRAIETADAIGKTADKLGIGIERLQEFRFAAEKAGVQTQTFDMAFQRFTRRAGEAARGTGEAKDALAQLGFTTEDLRTKAPDQLFLQVADAIARVEDPSQRLRLAFKLFDSEGVALVNMLRNGSSGLNDLAAEARSLGIVLSEDVVRRAEEANNELVAMDRVLGAASVTAGAEFIPFMRSIAQIVGSPGFRQGMAEMASGLKNMIEWMVEHKSLIGALVGGLGGLATLSRFGPWGALGGAIVGGVAGSQALMTRIDEISHELDQVDAQITRLTSDNSVDVIDRFFLSDAEIGKRLTNFRARKAELEAELNDLVNLAPDTASGFGPDDFLGGSGDLFETWMSPDDVRALTSALSMQNLEMGQLIDQYRNAPDAVRELRNQIEMENAARSQNIDLSSEAGRAWRDQYLSGLELTRTLADVEAITKETATAQEIYNQRIARLEELRPYLTVEQYTRALAAAQGELNKGFKVTRDIGQSAASSLEDAIFQAEKLNQVLNAFVNDIGRSAFRHAVSEPFGKGIASALGSIDFGGFFAKGGRPPVGIPSIVGEEGAELFVPDVPGTIIPNSALASAGGSNVEMNWYIDASNSELGVETAIASMMEAQKPQLITEVTAALVANNRRNKLGSAFS